MNKHMTTLFCLALPLLASCTMTVRPPATVENPETVVLLSHGRSSSLVLPFSDTEAVRYAFGDWRFYALGEKGVDDASKALFLPTPAALGRQVTPRGSEPDLGLAAHVGIGWDEAFPIQVERTKVDALLARLEALFQSGIESSLFNPSPNLVFVRPAERYSIVNNSNQKVAKWLEELGAEVRGVRLLSRWRVKRGRGSGSAGAAALTW